MGFDWLDLAGKMAAEGGEEAMQCSRPFHIMVAVAKNGAIGNKGQLPWPRLRTDLKMMATITKRAPPGKENAIVVGRKTWLSIPEKNRPLKGRFNVVLTSSPSTASSLMEAMKILSTPPLSDKIHEVFVLGGSGVYKEALQLPLLDRVYFTDIQQEFEGDAFFPEWSRESFELIEDCDVPKGIIKESGVEYTLLVYKRKPQ